MTDITTLRDALQELVDRDCRVFDRTLEGALLAFARAVERRALERAESGFAALLPGPYYMDPPDGGDVSVLEQVRRMTEDAARYRLLRQKICIVGNAFHVINVSPTYVAPDAAIELDAVLDSAMQSKAAALLLAEIERLDRAAAQEPKP